jgi:hypothetical protein
MILLARRELVAPGAARLVLLGVGLIALSSLKAGTSTSCGGALFGLPWSLPMVKGPAGMSAIASVTDGAAGAGVAVGCPAAVVAVGAGVLVGSGVGVGGEGIGVLVGRMAASVAAGKVGAGVPWAAGAGVPPPPPHAASNSDTLTRINSNFFIWYSSLFFNDE